MNCWDILGIEPTDNLKDVKRAYAKRSKEVHPEEHPDEFRVLHDSYEQAVNLCKSRMLYRPEPQIPEEPSAQDSLDEAFDEVKKTSIDEELEEAPVAADLDFDSIIKKENAKHARAVAKMTADIMAELERLSTMESGVELRKGLREITSKEDFYSLIAEPYFCSELTSFFETHEELVNDFYGEFYEPLRFDYLQTREYTGMYGELFNIFAQRNQLNYTTSAQFAQKQAAKDDSPPSWLVFVGIGLIAGLRVANATGALDRALPSWPYVMVAAIMFIVIIYSCVRQIKGAPKEESFSERVKDLFKDIWEYFVNHIPTAHIKRVDYYSKLLVATWIILLNVSFIWIGSEDLDTSMIGVFAFFAAVFALAIMLLTNIIIFIYSRVTKRECYKVSDPEKIIKRRRLFILLICSDIFTFIALAASIFS